MKLERVGALLLVAWMAGSCDEEPRAPESAPARGTVRTVRQEVRSTNKVLILGSSVSDGINSREAQAVMTSAPTAQIDVVTPAQWTAMTATQFMSYKALIIGDAACQSGTAAFQAAIDNRATWGAIVDGDVAIIAANPSSNNIPQLVENGIHFVMNSAQFLTGMYISLGCAYQDAEAPTHVELLEPFGEFQVQGLSLSCANSEHMFEMVNDLISRDTWDELLIGDDLCSTRTVLITYPEHTFSVAAIAMSFYELLSYTPGEKDFYDYTYDPSEPMLYTGTPYIVVRGAMPSGAGCGTPFGAEMGEECDLGDGVNGQPADESQQPWETCSWSCHQNWCGDGRVDPEFGEECDNGAQNGRTGDASGNIGTCSSFCKIPNIPSDSHPPIAQCADRTVQATNTCGMNVDINNGSFDADGDLVGCTQSPAGPYNIGTTTVTLTCTDMAGHSASCTATAMVTDKVLPVVTLTEPVSQSVECVQSGTYTDPGYRADDLCEGQLPQSSVARTGAVSLGVPSLYTLSYQAMDSSGNKSAIVTRLVSVADTQPPAITVHGPLADTFECGSTYVDPGASANDVCAGSVAVTSTQTGNPNQPGQIIYTYSATDPAGNGITSPVTRMVMVNDNAPPTLVLVGPVTQGLECGTPYTDPGATASDACFGDVTSRITTTGTVNNNVPGSYQITYSVTDPAGQTAPSILRTVNVSDTVAPSITVLGPLSQAVECGSVYADPGATASDACAGALTAVPITIPNADVPSTYTIAYTATDPSGNVGTSFASRTVVVSDTLPPTLTLNGQASMGLECATPFTDPSATASDQCAGTLPVTVVGGVNVQVPATYSLTYSADDGQGHSVSTLRMVTVSDSLPPEITVNGVLDQTYECGTTYVDPGATANDACDGELTAAIVATQSGNMSQPGTFTITYRVMDNAGHQTISPTQRTVTVNDTEPPTLALIGPGIQSLECGTPYIDPGATANDVCFGDVSSSITTTNSVNSAVPASYQITYNVTDPTGQTATPVHRTVNVQDTLKPVLVLNGQESVQMQCFTPTDDPTDPDSDVEVDPDPYIELGATGEDQCYGDVSPFVIVTGSVNKQLPGVYTLQYDVRDGADNWADPVTRTVEIIDNLAPKLMGSPPIHECSADNSMRNVQLSECAVAWDVCHGYMDIVTRSYDLQVTSNDPGNDANDIMIDAGGFSVRARKNANGSTRVYTATYKVDDDSLNTTVGSCTVTVSDNAAPTLELNGPALQSLECGTSYVDPGATATDTCDGDLTASIVRSGTVNAGAPNDYTLIYDVSDSFGNSASAVSRTVHVQDTQAPSITLTGPLTMTYECGTTYMDPGVTATDTCAGDLTAAIVATQTPVPNQPANFIITYSVTDPSGNTTVSPVQRTVTMSDNAPPSIALNGPSSQTLECSQGEYADPGATATDACVGNVPVTVTGLVNLHVAGNYVLSYSAQDTVGNTSPTVTRNVQITDTTGPTITLNGDLAVSVDCKTPYVDPGAMATDACAGDLTAAIVVTGTVNPLVPGDYTVSYNVADPAGNPAPLASRTVMVVDNEPPQIVCPDPIVVESSEGDGATVTPEAARATDTCDQEVRISGPSEGQFPPGTTTLTYTAMDASGNTASCTSTITVLTGAPPDTLIVSGPPDETEDTDARFSFDATKPDVTYECSLDGADFTECSATASFTALAEGMHTLTVRARDSAGRVDPTPASATWTVVPPPVEEVDRAFLGGGRGCSSTAGGPSSLAMMGLGVFAALVARKRMRARLLVLTVLLLDTRAFAQAQPVPTFELELLKLNPSGVGSLVLGTGELLPEGAYRLSLTTHYENDPLVLFQNGTRQGVVVRHRATAHLAAAYGLWGRLELGAQVPVLLLQRGDDLTAQGVGKPEGGVAPGTPLLTLRLKLLAEREQDPVDLALGVHAGPSLGSGAALARELRATPSLMAGRRLGFLHVAVDAGVLLRSHTILSPDANVQDEISHALRLGAALATLGEGLRGELTVIASVPFGREGSSIETLAGARLPVGESLEAYALTGLGYGTAPGTPDFRLLLGVAYGRTRPVCVMGAAHEPQSCPDLDADGDGVRNRDDRCPREPGPADNQGCPLKDTDADGIADAVDRCPSIPGLPALHGCPDQDGDGVEDGADVCPSEPGPVDRRGCPVKDSDGDGVSDEEDVCPTEPGIPEMHGCPPKDTDNDSVQDHLDNCPEVAGPADNQGCPVAEKQLVALQKDRIEIKDTVHFDFDKATIQSRSFPLLNQVARVLIDHPEIVSVTIEGHTDDRGSAEYNRDLSQRRAEAVRDYLAQQGVARERMDSKGFGEDRPMQSNSTDEGRAANRRVEFITRYTQGGP